MITQQVTQSTELEIFEKLLKEHETIIASELKLEASKQRYFSDYWGQTKSLGAWGGDFVIATSNREPEETREYFNQKGFNTVIPYNELVTKII
jgi:hypothetical protein